MTECLLFSNKIDTNDLTGVHYVLCGLKWSAQLV